DLGAQRRFPGRDREVDLEVAAVKPEARVRPEADAQEQVAGPGSARAAALPREPDDLAVADAARDVDFVVAAVGERDLALAAAGGFLEAQLEHRLLVTPAPREALEAAGAAAAAEQPFEQIGEVAVA